MRTMETIRKEIKKVLNVKRKYVYKIEQCNDRLVELADEFELSSQEGEQK